MLLHQTPTLVSQSNIYVLQRSIRIRHNTNQNQRTQTKQPNQTTKPTTKPTTNQTQHYKHNKNKQDNQQHVMNYNTCQKHRSGLSVQTYHVVCNCKHSMYIIQHTINIQYNTHTTTCNNQTTNQVTIKTIPKNLKPTKIT